MCITRKYVSSSKLHIQYSICSYIQQANYSLRKERGKMKFTDITSFIKGKNLRQINIATRSKLKKTLSLTFIVIMLLSCANVFHAVPLAKAAQAGPVFYVNQWSNWVPQQVEFNFPFGMAVAPNGNVYVADSDNNRIQELTSAGVYVTQWSYAGSDVGNMGHPEGVAVDSSGNVYVVDTDHNRVEEFTADGQLLAHWGGFGFGNGQFDGPTGIAIDKSSGNIYVSDWNRIEEFTSGGTYITQWGSSSSSAGNYYLGSPVGLAVDTSGNIYVASQLRGVVLEYTPSGASFVRQFGTLSMPYGVAVDSSGNVFVVDMSNNFVKEFSNSGGYLRQWGHYGPQNGNFTEPIGIALDQTGHVYVSSPGYTSTNPYASQDRVQVFSTSGDYIATWGRTGVGNDHFISPNSITLANGNVYVANGGAATVDEFSSTGTHLAQFGNGTYGSASNELWSPFGAAVDAQGNVYISDTTNNRIVVYGATGGPSTWGSYGVSWDYNGNYNLNPGKFNEPMGIAIGKSGNIYVADYQNSRIQEFSPAGAFITQWGGYGSGNTQFEYPRGIAIDSNGNVYVVDEIAARVQEFTSGGTYITQWGSVGTGPGQFERPSNIAVDSNGNVFVSDMDSNRITEFTSSGLYELQWGKRRLRTRTNLRPNGRCIRRQWQSLRYRQWRSKHFLLNQPHNAPSNRNRHRQLHFHTNSRCKRQYHLSWH
jgi:tripartite motif-containing protein 71